MLRSMLCALKRFQDLNHFATCAEIESVSAALKVLRKLIEQAFGLLDQIAKLIGSDRRLLKCLLYGVRRGMMSKHLVAENADFDPKWLCLLMLHVQAGKNSATKRGVIPKHLQEARDVIRVCSRFVEFVEIDQKRHEVSVNRRLKIDGIPIQYVHELRARFVSL